MINKRDKLFFIGLILFGFNFSIYCNDLILDYAMDLLKNKNDKNTFDKNGDLLSIVDSNTFSNYGFIALSYFRLGDQEKALSIIEKIADKNHRYEFIRKMIESKIPLKDSSVRIIENQIKSIDNYTFQLVLYEGLLLDYLDDSNNPIFDEIFSVRSNLIEKIRKNSEPDRYAYELSLNLNLIFHFSKKEDKKLNSLAEKLLLEVENCSYFQEEPETLILQTQTYLDLHLKEKVEKSLLTLERNSDKYETRELFEISKIYFSLNKYDEAEKYLLKIFNRYKNYKDKEVLNEFGGFIHLNNVFDRRSIINFIGNNEEILQIFKKSITTVPEKPEIGKIEYSGINEFIIQYYILTGRYNEAKDLAQRLDKTFDTVIHTDFYYHQMGLIYESSYEINSLIAMSEKLQSISFSVDLLLRAAKLYNLRNETGKYKRIMDKATHIVSSPRFPHERNILGEKGDVVMEWLEGECYNEAYATIILEKEDETRSMLMLELVQRYAFNNNIEKTKNIMEEICHQGYKALAISKIGAKLFCNGEDQKGIELLKSAILLDITNNTLNLDLILWDYVNAKLYKKVNIINFWENRLNFDFEYFSW